MREPTPLFTLLGIACYPYGAALALGLLLAALMAMASFRKAFGAAEDGLRFSLWALALGFVGVKLIAPHMARKGALSMDMTPCGHTISEIKAAQAKSEVK